MKLDCFSGLERKKLTINYFIKGNYRFNLDSINVGNCNDVCKGVAF